MLAFMICVYFGWRRYTWVAPFVVAILTSPIVVYFTIGKIASFRSAGLLGDLATSDWAAIVLEAVGGSFLGAFCGWGLGRVIARWRLSRAHSAAR